MIKWFTSGPKTIGYQELITLVFLALIAILMPFHNRYISYLFILWIFFEVMRISIHKKIELNSFPWYILLLPLYFLVTTFSLFYSSSFVHGIKLIEIKSLFLLLPLLIILADIQLSVKKKHLIVLLYTLALLLYIIVSLVNFVEKGLMDNVSRGLAGGTKLYQFARTYNLSFIRHNSYISLYLLWGIILIFPYYQKKLKWIYKIVFGLVQLAFLLYIWLLNSRASILSVLIISIYLTIKNILVKRNLIVISGSIIMVLFIILGALYYSRFGSNINLRILKFEETRLILFRNALDTWRESPVFGYGIGDYEQALLEHPDSIHLKEIVENKHDIHNQFLETGLQTGLIGFTVIMLIFIITFYHAYKNRNELICFFLIICFINLLFESMFQRLAGVLFFSFWYVFLILIYQEKKVL